jgi:hypothetical protein
VPEVGEGGPDGRNVAEERLLHIDQQQRHLVVLVPLVGAFVSMTPPPSLSDAN